jgi:hypothetical protein
MLFLKELAGYLMDCTLRQRLSNRLMSLPSHKTFANGVGGSAELGLSRHCETFTCQNYWTKSRREDAGDDVQSR